MPARQYGRKILAVDYVAKIGKIESKNGKKKFRMKMTKMQNIKD